jgi:hypothetical protein
MRSDLQTPTAPDLRRERVVARGCDPGEQATADTFRRGEMPSISEMLNRSSSRQSPLRPFTEADVELECPEHGFRWRATEHPPTTEGSVATYSCPEGCEIVTVSPDGGGWAFEKKGGLYLHP